MKTFLISIITTLSVLALAYFYMPFGIGTIGDGMLGTSVTTISGATKMSDFPDIYNTDMAALNAGKIEISTTSLPLITTLGGLTTAGALATVGTIGTGVWQATDIGVAYGGTGASTFGENLVLLGNGTGALKTVTAGSNDQVLTLVAGVPAWTSATVDETLDYDWTGTNTWATGSTTFNGLNYFNGYTELDDVLISSSTVSTPTLDQNIANKGYVDTEDNKIIHITASNNIKASSVATSSQTGGTPAKNKEIIVRLGGTIKTTFDLAESTDETGNAAGQIYINGTAVGTLHYTSGTTYQTKTDASLSVQPYDKVQLYLYQTEGTGTVYAKNFHIYWDETQTSTFYSVEQED